MTDISDDLTNKNAYYKVSEKQGPHLPPWDDVRVGPRSKGCKTKIERELDVFGLRVVETVNHHLADGGNYRNYRAFKKKCSYGNHFSKGLQKMAKKIVI